MNRRARKSRYNLPLSALAVYLLFLGMATAAHGMTREALVILGAAWLCMILLIFTHED